MRFWGFVYLVVTAWLIFFKREDDINLDEPDLDVGKVYKIMWSIVRLKSEPLYLSPC